MRRRWNRIHSQHVDAFRPLHAGCYRVSDFFFGKGDALVQYPLLLFGSPIGRQGQQDFQMSGEPRAMHIGLLKQEPGQTADGTA